MAERTLRVWANPYAAIDGQGRPAGACPKEASPLERQLGQHPGYVGAYVEDDSDAPKVGYGRGDPRTPPPRRVYSFGVDAVKVPFSAYYCDRLRDGELLPADDETGRAAGVPFVGRDEALRAACERAAALWTATTGTPAPFAMKEGQ